MWTILNSSAQLSVGTILRISERCGPSWWSCLRRTVDDVRVSPNHGWRHRFQTVGREVDASEGVVNAICRHGRRDVAEDYGDRTFKAMATALAKYPRYKMNVPASTASTGSLSNPSMA
jgi:hypothetical protein